MSKTVTSTKQSQLDTLAQKIISDKVCEELARTATQLVFGEGNPDSPIMFIGEAPGKEEDKQGRPFVGAAGKFLTQMIDSIGYAREDVYITNIVKYRPPNNRDPQPSEVTAFWPYLKKQISVIKPKLIVPLGRYSLNVFLPELSISAAHGKAMRKGGLVFMPQYHPAVALYNGGMRNTLLEDFAKIPKVLELIDKPKE